MYNPVNSNLAFGDIENQKNSNDQPFEYPLKTYKGELFQIPQEIRIGQQNLSEMKFIGGEYFSLARRRVQILKSDTNNRVFLDLGEIPNPTICTPFNCDQEKNLQTVQLDSKFQNPSIDNERTVGCKRKRTRENESFNLTKKTRIEEIKEDNVEINPFFTTLNVFTDSKIVGEREMKVITMMKDYHDFPNLIFIQFSKNKKSLNSIDFNIVADFPISDKLSLALSTARLTLTDIEDLTFQLPLQVIEHSLIPSENTRQSAGILKTRLVVCFEKNNIETIDYYRIYDKCQFVLDSGRKHADNEVIEKLNYKKHSFKFSIRSTSDVCYSFCTEIFLLNYECCYSNGLLGRILKDSKQKKIFLNALNFKDETKVDT